jgi:hypothetical protein
MQVDTGSSNFAVAGGAAAGAAPYFDASASSSFINIGAAVSVTYMIGSWKGTRVSDQVAVSDSGMAAVSLDFASISSSTSFFAQTSIPFQVHLESDLPSL